MFYVLIMQMNLSYIQGYSESIKNKHPCNSKRMPKSTNKYRDILASCFRIPSARPLRIIASETLFHTIKFVIMLCELW
jgi:hypothetical protein